MVTVAFGDALCPSNRLIARDTVEEKVLAPQASKRTLAEAIVTRDNSLIGGLTAEDLTALMS